MSNNPAAIQSALAVWEAEYYATVRDALLLYFDAIESAMGEKNQPVANYSFEVEDAERWGVNEVIFLPNSV
ncbi:MAG: hypothetical protein H8F28_01395 [Fibrella sp.]|nr:hypothetical protein [Armatimonadota bacterium]